MFLPDDAVRVAARSEYVDRWVSRRGGPELAGLPYTGFRRSPRMIEVAIVFLAVAALVGAGLFIWRPPGDQPRRALHFALRAGVLGAIAGPLVAFAVWQISRARTFQLFGEIVPRVETSAPVVALTFDDGPTPEFTGEILSLLRERGVRATFFVVGAELEKNMAEGQRIVLEGHELGNHSYSHDRMIGKSPAFVREEIERTDQLIRAAGHNGAIHFRSPFGKKFIVLPMYLQETNRKNIFMDVEPESYDDVAGDSEKIVQHVLDRAGPGSIILLHVMYESRAASMKAVPGIIDGLRAKGYGFRTVSELLADR
jgi:peptidoglycan/xylan/chitin deacetylase (PgdA/CDA1 family)